MNLAFGYFCLVPVQVEKPLVFICHDDWFSFGIEIFSM